MTPYADFTYFGLLLYIVVPTIILGLFGRANGRWAFFATIVIAFVQFSDDLVVRPGWNTWQLWWIAGYAMWQALLACAFVRWKTRATFYAAVPLTILPFVLSRWIPHLAPGSELGHLGLSYVTFRALDVIFSIHDGVLKSLSLAQYFAFVFFAPTLSSGPIDRYRRFAQDWIRKRNQSEFLTDLDIAVAHVFRGFLYKFILAALISTLWLKKIPEHGVLHLLNYMYGYTLYLFFDFAGYSAFAIGLSYLFGVRTPENFNLPFLARNIRDFWQRWHISLSFWFRDHVHMRFLLSAAKGKWFRGKHTANQFGLLLTFGLMGVWHGLELHYILYGLYHAALLIGYDWFTRWNKQRKFWGETRPWLLLNRVLTIHVVCFGLLLFSGRITPKVAHPAPEVEVAQPTR